MKVAVSVGHHPGSPGYRYHNVSEYSEMSILAGLLINKLQRSSHKAYLIGTGGLKQKVMDINALDVDYAVELHLNAGGGHGFETLYCPGSSRGKYVAGSVNSAISTVLNTRNRGVKEGWYKMNPANGPDYFLNATNCPAIITEIYFLDNETERERFGGNLQILDDIATQIVIGILVLD